jgi:hypothetical protein
MNALGPEGRFTFEVVPLADGTALGRTIYATHQVLVLLDQNALVVKQRAIRLTGQQGDYLALDGKLPGLAVLDGEPPSFVSFTPQALPQPLELPRAREVLPCRGPKPPRSLTVFTFDEGRLGWNQATNEESFGMLEVTPRAACLRGAQALSPVWAKVTARGAALGGAAQGAHRVAPVTCVRESR